MNFKNNFILFGLGLVLVSVSEAKMGIPCGTEKGAISGDIIQNAFKCVKTGKDKTEKFKLDMTAIKCVLAAVGISKDKDATDLDKTKFDDLIKKSFPKHEETLKTNLATCGTKITAELGPCIMKTFKAACDDKGKGKAKPAT